MGLMTTFPVGAVLIGLVFLVLSFKNKSKSVLVTGLIWLCYSLYEFLMFTRVLCSGECNIRVDLLVIYPVLVFISLLALVKSYLKKRRSHALSAKNSNDNSDIE